MSMHSSQPEPWRVVRSESVVQDAWINLRADDCVDQHGRTVAPYYVLDYADWVTVLALTPGGEVVAVEEYHHGAGLVDMGLIGGGVNDGETAAAAAERELREETGFTAGRLIDLGWAWANWSNQSSRSHHFLALDCTRTSTQQLDDTESIAVRLMSQEECGQRLRQSYHQLTWLKALPLLRA
ncbi:NUDIX domain-containing protein [Microbacterium sp. YY-01]|uniref:NUDIX domain-containing protein n=1 Tax=Microbacterium sp. YY-01 TaxID=3421634 RepID=UPI003D16E585